MQRQSRALAACLKAHGIVKGDRIAILSAGKKDWVVSELAILYIGAINVPLSTKLETADLVFRLNHSSCRMLFASEYQYQKLSAQRDALPLLEKVVLFENKKTFSKNESFVADLVLQGEQLLREHPTYIDAEMSAVHEEDSAIISYTSGTSADPKGVVLSHKNMWVNSLQCVEFFPLSTSVVSLLVLPIDHSFAHTALMYTVMRCGASLASVQQGRSPADALRNLPLNMKEVRPQLMISVPALSKNFKKNIEAAIKEKGPLVSALFKIGIACGTHYHGIGWNRGRGLRFLSFIPYKIIDALVFKKIREVFGGRLESFVGGGALLDIELQKFFFSVGIPIYQGYGLTEASPVISANTRQAHKMGSSGKIVNHLEVKICDDLGNELPRYQKGEIVVRGENVMKEYYLNPKATADTIKDGWLYSGDMGYIDKDNFLYVLGRFKSLLIGADGEKYSPEGIEELFVEKSKIVEQVMLFNDHSPYTTAVIVPNKDALKSALVHHKHLVDKSASREEAAIALIEKEIAEFKHGGRFAGVFPERWLPSTFVIAGDAFTEDNKMINSTMKMVRAKIVEAYKDRINALYTPDGKQLFNAKNIETVKKIIS